MDTIYDAVVVGAGFSGAMIAKQLGLAGKRVLILEAGAEIPENVNDFMERFYGASAKVPETPYTPELFGPDGMLTNPGTLNAGRPTVLTLDVSSWKDAAKSYLIQNGPLAFASTYERIGGGTGRHWLGSSFRFLPNDFRMQSEYGQLVDWPLGYDDLKSWYGRAEAEIGVSANVQEQTYSGVKFTDGYIYPMNPIPLSLVDQAVAAAVNGMEMDGIPLRVRSTPAARNSQPYQHRPVCAGNTNCIPICPIQAKYDPSVTVNEALDTGSVEILYRSVASEIIIGNDGKVSSVNFIQYAEPGGAPTKRDFVRARVFILAAHAIETPKLLLMSKNGGRTPRGVANSSGQVGKNLMDHPLYLAWALAKDPVFPYRGPLSTGGIEELRDGKFRQQRAAFRVEIGNEGWNFPIGDPFVSTVDFVNGTNTSGLNEPRAALSGSALIEACNSNLTRQFRLAFLVEQAPEERNCVTLAAKTDHLGLPRPAIQYDFSQYTKNGLVSAKKLADQIFAKMGARPFTSEPDKNDPCSFPMVEDGKETSIKYFGSGHIVGTHRMGSDKTKSVVDGNQRSWDHPNLFIAGSGSFPTVATGNPSLTIAALALLTADSILRSDLRN